LKDALGASGLGRVRENGALLPRTLAALADGSGIGIDDAPGNLDWSRKSGWYADLKSNASGERVTVDMQLQLGMLKAASNLPSTDACSAGGSSWRYAFDLASGLALPGSLHGVVGYKVSDNALLTGLDTLRLQGGKTSTLLADSAGGVQGAQDPSAPAAPPTVKRISWRELPDQ
jgi:type IV pilus assembly protein PilY1